MLTVVVVLVLLAAVHVPLGNYIAHVPNTSANGCADER